MPGVNEAQSAARMHSRVVIPLVEALRRRGSLFRYTFVTINAVLSDDEALVTFEGGHQTVLKCGMLVPDVGERWRAVDWGAGYVLDDLAVAI